MNTPAVTTASGPVSGRVEDGVAVFRGIPYAAPPVGDLHLRAPVAPAPWSDVLDAGTYGPPPPQSKTFGVPDETVTGDDWLTVNVWSADLAPGTPAPVMVWIYGGAYRIGHASEPVYDGRRLAGDGVVVVTFNHRVGVEGYGQIEGTPANRGLLDQVAALEWVRDNITAFGGDPDRVTVFGESAGAGAIASLLAMPTARGLFSRAILSSVPGTFLSAELAADVMGEIAARLGRQPALADLADVDPDALVDAADQLNAELPQYADRWGVLAATPTPFSPVVDGEVLPTTPWAAIAGGSARDVELIVGHNQDEFRLFVAMIKGPDPQVSSDEADATLALFAPDPDAYRAAYPGVPPIAYYELVQSDWLFRIPTLRLAEAQVTGGGAVSFYDLVWPSPAFGGALGACHALDVPLVWGNFPTEGLSSMLIDPPNVAAAQSVSEHIRSAWTAFARGDSPAGFVAFDPDRTQVAVIGDDIRVGDYPAGTSRRIWADTWHPGPPALTVSEASVRNIG